MTPILQMKKLGPQHVRNLPKFPQLICVRARIPTQAVWLESVLYHLPDWQPRNSKAPKEKEAEREREQIKNITKLWKMSSDWLRWRALSATHGRPLWSPFRTSTVGDSGLLWRCEHKGGWNQAVLVTSQQKTGGLSSGQDELETPDLGNQGTNHWREGIGTVQGIKWKWVQKQEPPVPSHHKIPRMITAKLIPLRQKPEWRPMDSEHIALKRAGPSPYSFASQNVAPG